MSVKVFVDLDDPGKPLPGTVREGYDLHLDLPRPRFMDEYLEYVHQEIRYHFTDKYTRISVTTI